MFTAFLRHRFTSIILVLLSVQVTYFGVSQYAISRGFDITNAVDLYYCENLVEKKIEYVTNIMKARQDPHMIISLYNESMNSYQEQTLQDIYQSYENHIQILDECL